MGLPPSLPQLATAYPRFCNLTQNSAVQVIQNNKTRCLTNSEYNQKLSFITQSCEQDKTLQIMLHSTVLNNYDKIFVEKMKEAKEKKTGKGLLIPILLSIETHSSSLFDNQIILISEEIKFKNDKNELMDFYQVSWNEFISQILSKHARSLIFRGSL